MRYIYIFLVLFVCFLVFIPKGFAQNMAITIKGKVIDTTAKQGLSKALMMVIRYQDSSLVGYSRSDEKGFFAPIKVTNDTFFIIVSHPKFSDQTYFLVPAPGDTLYNFSKVVLPPKSVTLNEVVVVADKERVFYRGDTLIFNADSFKTKANATVEDLLKKLPGVRVDAKGKITVQGKQVDQVLVDGDEFFGSDPTVATKNLNANTVETVQVFEKKSDNVDSQDETVKVMNLKLKEDAKKGYFGKISAAGDYHPFYEGDLLVNRFRKSQKISVFALGSNTPRQGFDWSDADKYGLSNEFSWNYDEENDTWMNNGDNQNDGIPQILKTGFYFNDKLGKKTKINTDYTYTNRFMNTFKEQYTQFFFTDTSYNNSQINNGNKSNQSHQFNLRVTQKLDSLTDLTISPRVRIADGSNSSTQEDDFFTAENAFTRQTYIASRSVNYLSDIGGRIRLERRFKKKDRHLNVSFNTGVLSDKANGFLRTDYTYQNNALNTVLDQKRTSINEKRENSASIIYTEPLTKKIKLELGYDFSHAFQDINRRTLDNTGVGYDLENINQTNNFRNTRIVNRVSTKLIYEVKKYRFAFGTRLRQIEQRNINLSNNVPLNLKVQNVLPFANWRYRFNQGTSLSLDYSTNANQPDVKQLQPVSDNSDPNRIYQGNPSLKPSFGNNVRLNFYTYQGISDRNFYANGNFNNTYNAITNTLVYDSIGRAISQPVNVNGNYNANMYIGGGIPVFKEFMKVYLNVNSGINNNISFVNGQKNTTRNINSGSSLSLEKQEEKYEIGLGTDYNYTLPSASLSNFSNQPFNTYSFRGNFSIKLPKKFVIESDANYSKNNQRADGYNISFVVWNASISKTFLKTENLVVSLLAYDILNQNVNNTRNVMDNRIVDTRVTIIRQYFLAKVLFKFNNQKTKEEENDY
jgi:outer membrane receptor protein involved in Fe transport